MEGCRGKQTGICGLTRRAFIRGSAAALALLALPWRPAAPPPRKSAWVSAAPPPPPSPRSCPKAWCSASSAPGTARCWTATGATAASGRTAKACTTAWFTATPAPSTWTRWRRSPSSTCCPAAARFPSPPRAATCTASSARTGKFPRPGRKRPITTTCPRKRWWPGPKQPAAPPSPIPTSSPSSSMST